MLVKVCGKSVYGFMEEGIVWVNMEEIEEMYYEEYLKRGKKEE